MDFLPVVGKKSLREAMRMYFMDPWEERKGPRGKFVRGRGRKKGRSWVPEWARRKSAVVRGEVWEEEERSGEASKREERWVVLGWKRGRVWEWW